MFRRVLAGFALLTMCQAPAFAEDAEPVVVDGLTFDSLYEYLTSEYFQTSGNRCGTAIAPDGGGESDGLLPPSDCANTTTISGEYAPGELWEIPVFVHVIYNSSGQGNIAESFITSQIDILNEDLQALAGTPGAPGTNCRVRFKLADEDAAGNPSTGITRTQNDSWYNDSGSYWNVLAEDPNRFMNIYTMGAPGGSTGILGYVPFLPHQGTPGSLNDRIVIGWRFFGRNSPGAPYNQGRTATHEVGHYLGMYHTFNGGCGTASCYTTGDRICDTEPEASNRFGCPTGATSCGTPDPIRNYMDYTNDTCMNQFTPEQCNRIRCTLTHYRPDVWEAVSSVAVGDAEGNPLFYLYQNRPNPFNPTTKIRFDLVDAGAVSLRILDVNGRTVRDLSQGGLQSGLHTFTWDGLGNDGIAASSGVYFYRLETAGQSVTRRMVMLK